MTRVSKVSLVVLVALLLALSFAATALADDRIIQNDPDNPIKFSIDAAIANGSVSTADLYIGTVGSYLGAKADGSTPVFKEGFGKNPYDILIMNDKVGIVLAVGTPDPWGYPGGSILDAGRVVSVPAGATDLKSATFGPDTVLTVQFLFNTWDAWAPANTGIVYCDLVKYDFAAKAIDNVNGVPAVQVKRKFAVPYNDGGVSVARDLDVISYYSIPADKEYAYMFDKVVNNGVAFSKECANEISLSNKGGDGIDTKTVAALASANTYNWVADEAGEPTRAFSTTIISPGENPGSDGRLHPLASFTGARGYRELAFADPGLHRRREPHLRVLPHDRRRVLLAGRHRLLRRLQAPRHVPDRRRRHRPGRQGRPLPGGRHLPGRHAVRLGDGRQGRPLHGHLPDESARGAVSSAGREVGHDCGPRKRRLHRRHRPRRGDRPQGRGLPGPGDVPLPRPGRRPGLGQGLGGHHPDHRVHRPDVLLLRQRAGRFGEQGRRDRPGQAG